MAKAASVVSIDGADYDVASGQVIGSIKKTAKRSGMPTAAQVIDGFIKKSSHAHAPKAKAKIAGAKVVAAKRIPKSRQNHRVESASSIHRRAEASKTLMRRGLERPASKVKAATRTLANPSAGLHKVIDPAKLARAKMIARSEKVSRYNGAESGTQQKPRSSEVKLRPAQPAGTSSRPASMNSLAATSSHQRLERMLDIALARADAHKHARQNHRHWSRLWLRSRWMGLAVVVLVALSASLVFAWRDIPTVAIKLADIRSHVPATLPSYTPVGYQYSGPVNYGAGKVTLIYKDAATPERAYSLSQQKSDWDSTTLQNNINSPKNQVQSSQANGLTVYIYNGNASASWVNNGMLYSIQNKANLSSDQILNIAQSL